ncbi:MAG TPA: hypothetical protein VF142_06855, partial [Longimicrobium sp.]
PVDRGTHGGTIPVSGAALMLRPELRRAVERELSPAVREGVGELVRTLGLPSWDVEPGLSGVLRHAAVNRRARALRYAKGYSERDALSNACYALGVRPETYLRQERRRLKRLADNSSGSNV